ncbi:hypothetical protein C922_03890 [Plasmodium inui San Antonio 1]|uniref:Uncharacterized protein n=1 Tax=Plasmodium inui San Antonio 1 TaxID=1237626 RepID=W7A939_9APIC|nr:hypothetical protein C922_03890 [Plasmodium inui San Antonio 1]EUD65644.1 hypothetical protein C922_03890 [Plasmodium inui San Antonio 1]
MGANICVFQRKKYDEEKKELALEKAPRRVTRKEQIVNEITCEGVTKCYGEETSQLGKTKEEGDKSILSVPSTSTNSIFVESEEATTDISSFTSSSMIRSNIKANIIRETYLLQNSYGQISDLTRRYRSSKSSPPLGEANKTTFKKSASFGGTVPHSNEKFRDLSEFIRTKKEDAHEGNYLTRGKNYPSEKSHSQRSELCSIWGDDDPLYGGVSTGKEDKATTKEKEPFRRMTNGKVPLRRMTDERTLTDQRRREDNSSSVKPKKLGKRGKSLNLPSWDNNADYKGGPVPLTKCNSSYFNNRGVIIYS